MKTLPELKAEYKEAFDAHEQNRVRLEETYSLLDSLKHQRGETTKALVQAEKAVLEAVRETPMQ